MTLQNCGDPHPSLSFKLKHEFARPLNFRLRKQASRAEWIARLLRPALGSFFAKRRIVEELHAAPLAKIAANGS